MENSEELITDTLLMIRPARFGFNEETAASNVFQKNNSLISPSEIQQHALNEFDSLVKKLREQKIYVIVLQDTDLQTPDSIFPNNWISFHRQKIILYPMMAESRRRERKPQWISLLSDLLNQKSVEDLSGEEKHKKFLEGTGSIVPDRKNRIAYANHSLRTNEELFVRWCEEMGYAPVIFRTSTSSGNEIYHTNVMMSIGKRTAVVCTEIIRNEDEKANVLKNLSLHHKIIEISEEQMNNFCGNLLLVKNREGKQFWVMSDRAYQAFAAEQKSILEEDGELIYSGLETIEKLGGGSARCMMAEIY